LISDEKGKGIKAKSDVINMIIIIITTYI